MTPNDQLLNKITSLQQIIADKDREIWHLQTIVRTYKDAYATEKRRVQENTLTLKP